MSSVTYPAGGWLPPGAHFDWQRSDQGRDFVTNWKGIIQAPGKFRVVNVGSNGVFPNGFGPDYPWVEIQDGRFRGHTFYLGHCSSVVPIGLTGDFGHPLARADQGYNFEGTNGGWVELGEVQPSGVLGPNNPNGHWFDGLLTSPLVVGIPNPDPNGYHRFADAPFPRGAGVIHERKTVKEYDRLREHGNLHQRRLNTLREDVTFLRKRLWIESHPYWRSEHSTRNPTWNKYDRWWRFWQLDHRAKGQRIGVDFHA